MTMMLTPVLLTSLLLLWLAQPWLNRLPYARGVLLVNAMAVGIVKSSRMATAKAAGVH